MNEDPGDKLEVALFTLSRFLPFGYAKESPYDVVSSAINYIKYLHSEVQKPPPSILYEPFKPSPAVSCPDSIVSPGLVNLSGVEETLILQELGLDILYDSDTYSELYTNSDCKAAANWENGTCLWKIKRPSNGFIRFAAEKRQRLLKLFPNRDNRDISRYLGVMWRQLPESEKRRYHTYFLEEIARIKTMFPHWNYAASRARNTTMLNMAHDSSQILPSRLRQRKYKKNYKALSGNELALNAENSVADLTLKVDKKASNTKKMKELVTKQFQKIEAATNNRYIKVEEMTDEYFPKIKIEANESFPKIKKIAKKRFPKIKKVANDCIPKIKIVANECLPKIEEVTGNYFSKIDDERSLPIKKRKRKETILWVQCDICKKWRKLPSSWKNVELPEHWFCLMNPVEMYRSCSAPQEI